MLARVFRKQQWIALRKGSRSLLKMEMCVVPTEVSVVSHHLWKSSPRCSTYDNPSPFPVRGSWIKKEMLRKFYGAEQKTKHLRISSYLATSLKKATAEKFISNSWANKATQSQRGTLVAVLFRIHGYLWPLSSQPICLLLLYFLYFLPAIVVMLCLQSYTLLSKSSRIDRRH